MAEKDKGVPIHLKIFSCNTMKHFIKMFANSADPNQTAPLEQSDLGLHCLQKFMLVGILVVKTCFYYTGDSRDVQYPVP